MCNLSEHVEAKGLEKGRREGKEEGSLEARLEIAQKLLDKNFPKEEVCQISGLTGDQLDRLKEKMSAAV